MNPGVVRQPLYGFRQHPEGSTLASGTGGLYLGVEGNEFYLLADILDVGNEIGNVPDSTCNRVHGCGDIPVLLRALPKRFGYHRQVTLHLRKQGAVSLIGNAGDAARLVGKARLLG